MRRALVSLTAVAFAISAFAAVDTASAAKMSKMGCMVGKEKWDASAGKCMAAKPVKKAAKKTAKKTA